MSSEDLGPPVDSKISIHTKLQARLLDSMPNVLHMGRFFHLIDWLVLARKYGKICSEAVGVLNDTSRPNARFSHTSSLLTRPQTISVRVMHSESFTLPTQAPTL